MSNRGAIVQVAKLVLCAQLAFAGTPDGPTSATTAWGLSLNAITRPAVTVGAMASQRYRNSLSNPPCPLGDSDLFKFYMRRGLGSREFSRASQLPALGREVNVVIRAINTRRIRQCCEALPGQSDHPTAARTSSPARRCTI